MPTPRKLLILVAVLVATVGALALFIHHVMSVAPRTLEMPEVLKTPRVLIGEGQLKKRLFYTSASIGSISQILPGWPANREGAAFVVVGNKGADFLEGGSQLKKQVVFSRSIYCPVEVVRLDRSGEYGFLTRDQSWSIGVILFDKRGKQLWSYGSFLPGVDDSAAGDVDGDGKAEVVVGFNGGGGIRLLDAEGKKIWEKRDANVWHVEILESKGDQPGEILNSNAAGRLTVRDARGSETARYFPGHYVTDFALTKWNGDSRASHILVPSRVSHQASGQARFFVLDSAGAPAAQLDAPLGGLLKRTRGTPVRFSGDAGYYAVLQNFRAWKRSMLFLYDSKGQLAYQEILADSCGGLAASPKDSGERLLIGCTGEVWEYSP